MASVKIDLGFGEQAILSDQANSAVRSAKHQRDAEEFLRRWPRTRSMEQERSYLRQLGLHLGQTVPGIIASDTSAQLREAVKSGKVMVVIERAAPTGDGVSGAGPTTPPYPLAMREKAAWVAPTRTPTRSYQPPRYDDVSADDLINYIQSVLGSTPTEVAAQDVAPSMSLADAQPFEYGEDSASEDAIQLAGGEGTPGNNQAQNKQFRAVVKALGLDQDQAQELHQEISKQGLGYHEIMQRGIDMFGGGDD
jgi:hypothetical protein